MHPHHRDKAPFAKPAISGAHAMTVPGQSGPEGSWWSKGPPRPRCTPSAHLSQRRLCSPLPAQLRGRRAGVPPEKATSTCSTLRSKFHLPAAWPDIKVPSGKAAGQQAVGTSGSGADVAWGNQCQSHLHVKSWSRPLLRQKQWSRGTACDGRGQSPTGMRVPGCDHGHQDI